MTTGVLVRMSSTNAVIRSPVDPGALVRKPLNPEVTDWPVLYTDRALLRQPGANREDCDTGTGIPNNPLLYSYASQVDPPPDVTPPVVQWLTIQYAPGQVPQGPEWDLLPVNTPADCAKNIDADLWFEGDTNRLWFYTNDDAWPTDTFCYRVSYGIDLIVSNATVEVGEVYSTTFRFVVPTDPVETWTLLPPTPAGAVVTPNGSYEAAVSWDTTGQTAGDYTFTLQADSLTWVGVSGSYSSTDTVSWTVTVEEPVAGDPPVITPILDAVASVALIAYTENVTLVSGDLPITAWELTQKPTGVVQDPTITDNGDGTATVQWILAAGDIGGPYPFTVQATNAAGSDTESWNVTVEE